MSSDQPFNELGQILAAGGEIALGLAISRGWTSGQIGLLFAKRFDPITEHDRARLFAIANAAVEAAATIQAMDPESPIDLETIPTNPFLFGDEPGGRRGSVAGRFMNEATGQWYDIRVDVADISNPQAMFDDAAELIRSNWSKYPEGTTGAFGKGQLDQITIELHLVERRF